MIFLDQVEAAANDARLYYLALAGALVVPDICGALEAEDGEATPARYKTWFDNHIAPLHSFDNDPPYVRGEDCYQFRCSFLHQGRTQHPKSEYSRILFIEPGAVPGVVHMVVIGDALVLDVREFCLEMVAGARRWIAAVIGTEPYQSNLGSFVQRYPNGLLPYIKGAPIIS